MSWDVGGGSFVSISTGGAVVVVRWRARKNKKTNYIVCFKTLKKEKKKEGKTVQEPKLLLVPE